MASAAGPARSRPAPWGVVFAAMVVAWALWLPAAAWGAAAVGSMRVLAFPVYSLGHYVCHQRPERSFHWAGVPWPVCARCVGIYWGIAAAACAGLGARRAVPPVRARWFAGLAGTPALATAAYEWTTGVVPSNLTRAATGVLLGSVLGYLVAALLADATPGDPPVDEVN